MPDTTQRLPRIVPPPGSCGAARERVESKDPSVRCVDWFLCFKKLG